MIALCFNVIVIVLGTCDISQTTPTDKTRKQETRKVLGQLNEALASFHDVNGRDPTEKEGLEVLLGKNPLTNQPYITRGMLLDSWDHRIVYRKKEKMVAVISRGPDGLIDTKDDLTSVLEHID